MKGHWCLRQNSETYHLFGHINNVDGIKIRRLGWTGHIIRMEEERTPKKILNGEFHNTGSVGRK
jgi:hypothetical protein